MRKFIKISLIALLALLLLGAISSFLFAGFTVFNETTQLITNEQTTIAIGIGRLEKSGFDLDSFQSKYKIERVSIKSSWDDHHIPADHILVDGNNDNNTVIIVHGLGANRISMYRIAEMFLERGFNVLAYDQRSSGENTAPYTTFGYWESRDMVDYSNYIGSIISNEHKIILYGTSFGGATTGIALGNDLLNEKVSLAILDSPLSSMREMIVFTFSNMDIPLEFMDFMLYAGNMVTNVRLGFNYDDAEVVDHISKTQLPVLIIGTEADTVTPFHMCEDIYNAIPHENKKLFADKDAKHALIFHKDKELYEEEVFGFINRFD